LNGKDDLCAVTIAAGIEVHHSPRSNNEAGATTLVSAPKSSTAGPYSEYTSFEANATEDGKDIQMLDSALELLGSLFLTVLTLLIGSCIVGSMVAALRAVSRGSATSPWK
jgi:hypothetical protein